MIGSEIDDGKLPMWRPEGEDIHSPIQPPGEPLEDGGGKEEKDVSAKIQHRGPVCGAVG